MRSFGKWLGRSLLVVLLGAVVVAVWKREEINRVLAVNSLFDADRIVSNFSTMNSAFLTVPLATGTQEPSALPTGTPFPLPARVQDWLVERQVTSLLIMKDGAVVYEDYFLDTAAEDHRISWSVAKSYLSALVGVLLSEGAIGSLDDPVTQYAPALAGGAYDATTVRDVLTMSSGVLFDEDYLDPGSDINRMGRVLALGGKMDQFAADLTETFAVAGAQWQYVSIDTHVIGMVVRGATGRSVPALLSEKIVAPLQLEGAPYYLTDGVGTAFVLGGLNVMTRDYARFAQMFVQRGMWQGEQIVPEAWVVASTSPAAPPAGPNAHPAADFYDYGYQWWIPKDGGPREYLARGIYGQYLYINEAEGVVIVSTAADRQFRVPGVDAGNVAIFRAIVDAL
ncbi:MAG: serine hydrolase [Pseudomonadota bacterium]